MSVPVPGAVPVLVQQPGRSPLRLLVSESLDVGRDCLGLLLTDPLVSRCHVTLEAVGSAIRVRDRNSTNGTTVDGVPLVGAHDLVPGEVVRLGSTTIQLLVDDLSLRRTTSIDLAVAAFDLSRLPGRSDQRAVLVGAVEDANRRAVALGADRWRLIVNTLQGMVARQVVRYHGVAVGERDDVFVLSFPNAAGAVACALGIDRAVRALTRSKPVVSVPVRMAAHVDGGAGPTELVEVAARLAAAAAGGEVLVSRGVRSALGEVSGLGWRERADPVDGITVVIFDVDSVVDGLQTR